MTPKRLKFCHVYVETGNASEAYRRAFNCRNMKPETIKKRASELLRRGDIRGTLKKTQAEHRKKHDLTVGTLLEELEKARLLALQKKNPSAAISASMGKARLMGLLIKEQNVPIKLGKISGSLADQGQQIIMAMGNGKVSPADTSSMLNALAAQARIVEVEELEKRVAKLEGQHDT